MQSDHFALSAHALNTGMLSISFATCNTNVRTHFAVDASVKYSFTKFGRVETSGDAVAAQGSAQNESQTDIMFSICNPVVSNRNFKSTNDSRACRASLHLARI